MQNKITHCIGTIAIYDDRKMYQEIMDDYFEYDYVQEGTDLSPIDCAIKDIPRSHWAYGWTESLAQSDDTSGLICFWVPKGEMRVKAVVTLPDYDASFGDDKKCICGHAYRSHFQGEEDLKQVGCSDCGFHIFREKKNEH